MLTIPKDDWEPTLPDDTSYIKGQLERGSETGYLHWQLLVVFNKKKSLPGVKKLFGNVHAELTRSEAADDYVWKEDTRAGEPFELGSKPIQRNSKPDWDRVWDAATTGNILEVPSDIRVRHYTSLRRIQSDHSKPTGMERTCAVYWGNTGTGKSRTAWRDAGVEAFPKIPTSKFWDGYAGHEHVVIDEFRGGIDISHLLRWLDRYPVVVETKGSSVVLKAKKIWITSNLHPREWYPGLDDLTYAALERRLEIVHFEEDLTDAEQE